MKPNASCALICRGAELEPTRLRSFGSSWKTCCVTASTPSSQRAWTFFRSVPLIPSQKGRQQLSTSVIWEPCLSVQEGPSGPETLASLPMPSSRRPRKVSPRLTTARIQRQSLWDGLGGSRGAKRGLRSLPLNKDGRLPEKRPKLGGLQNLRVPEMRNIHKAINTEISQSADTRKRHFRRAEKYLDGRKLVSFFTSFNYAVEIKDEDCDMLQSVLQQLNLSKGLAIMISSPGGDGMAAERIVNTCRAYSGTGDYWALVPAKAKSAATIVCMGASRIYMAPSSELGPVDPQILKVEDGRRKAFSAHNLVQGYNRLFNEAKKTKGPIEPFLQQLSHYDDREITTYRSLIDLAENISVKVLKTGMLKRVAEKNIKKKIEMFLNPAAGTHQYIVCRTPEPYDADAYASVHALDQRILEKGREPSPRCEPAFHVLQFRAHPSELAGDACDGGWCYGSALGVGGYCAFGRLINA